MQHLIDLYLENEPIEYFKNLLIGEKDKDKILKDYFGSSISFGTAGLRGLMKPGTSGINGYTVGKASAGFAHFLKKRPHSGPITVCIAYDNRHHSQKFAQLAAQVLAHYGIHVKVSRHLRPTPWLSFAVRHYKASGGIMITASHNPKEYNGYKVYLSDGGQVTSPFDKEIMKEISMIEHFELSGVKSPLIELIDHDVDDAYLLNLKSKFKKPTHHDLSIIYSPLCGTGSTLVPKALEQFGFNKIELVQEEATFDPDFNGILTPNPETEIACQRSKKLLFEKNADIALVTDPDADRIGCIINHHGHIVSLNGNQIALLLLDYLIKHTDPTNKVVVSSFVTTHLIDEMCKKNNLIHKEVLTGFKYIGQVIDELEKHHEASRFLLGAEESYGYLIGTHAKDKDAIVTACVLAFCAQDAKVNKKTLYDILLDIYAKYGLSVEETFTFEFKQNTPSSEIQKKLQPIFSSYPDTIFGEKVERVIDFTTSKVTDLLNLQTSKSSLPEAQALGLYTKNSWLIIRPSGTEPKIKLYAGIHQIPHGPIDLEKDLLTKKLKLELAEIANHLFK